MLSWTTLCAGIVLQDGRPDGEPEPALLHRLAALAAYQQLQEGHVASAVAIVKHFCPAVLEVGLLGHGVLPDLTRSKSTAEGEWGAGR